MDLRTAGGRALLIAIGALLLSATHTFADGWARLGFARSVEGKINYVTYTSYHGTPATNSGTFVVDLPEGVTILSADIYYGFWWYRCFGGREAKTLNFAGNTLAPHEVGNHCVAGGGGFRVYRNDVSAFVTGDGSYSYWMAPKHYRDWNAFPGASLLIVYEDPSLTADYQLEIHDGSHLGGPSYFPTSGPWPRPTVFTAFTVDGNPAPEVEVGYLVLGYKSNWGWQEAHLFNGVTIGQNLLGDSVYFHRFDVSNLVSVGDESAVANLEEIGDCMAWWMSILRVRSSPFITDTTPPELQIVSHAGDPVVGSSPATVVVAVRDESGTTISSDPVLTWDPETLPPETMGESSADYYLVEGPNPLTVTATDEVELSSSESVTITLDTVFPTVVITAPGDGDIVGSPSVGLSADVADATVTEVFSSPEGIDTVVEAGGGSVNGTIALTEGSNVLSITATDRAGHSSGDSVTVILDTVPPEVTISAPAQQAVLGLSPASLTVNVVDATTTTVTFGTNSVVLDPGGGVAAGDVELDGGWNAVAVVATDGAGNVTEVVLDLLLDLSAPVVTIDWPIGGSLFGPGDSPIAVTATVDDLSATTIDSTPPGVSGWLPQGGGMIPGSVALEEGHNAIEVRAVDETDRTGSGSVSVIFDTTPPVVAIVSPTSGAAVRGAIDFDVTAEDVEPGSSVDVVDLLVDGGLYESFASPAYGTTVDTKTLADGTHHLAADATDGVGNTGSASIPVLVDNTAPAVGITRPFEGEILGGEIDLEVTASDGGSALAEVEMRLGGSAPNRVDGSDTYDPPQGFATCYGQDDTSVRSEGPTTFAVRAVDDAGNDAEVSITVILDNTPPEWTLLEPADGSVVGGLMDIVAAADDPHLATLEILVDGQSLGTSSTSPYSLVCDTSLRLDGAMTVTVVATDMAGNHSTCTAKVTIDNVNVAISPQTLNLKSKGKTHSITAVLEGPNLHLLLPTEENQIELRLPGGNPVLCTADFPGDDTLQDSDGDGLDELTLKFDRQLLISSIQAAIDAELVDPKKVPVTLVAAGGFEIGSDLLKIVGK